MSSKSRIKTARADAFLRQAGNCCYCGYPMWLDNPNDLSEGNKITLAQAKRLQCTAEHLKSRQDGGGDSKNNIAAACLHCNLNRHKRKKAPDPDSYRQLVQGRMVKGRWHQFRIAVVM